MAPRSWLLLGFDSDGDERRVLIMVWQCMMFAHILHKRGVYANEFRLTTPGAVVWTIPASSFSKNIACLVIVDPTTGRITEVRGLSFDDSRHNTKKNDAYLFGVKQKRLGQYDVSGEYFKLLVAKHQIGTSLYTRSDEMNVNSAVQRCTLYVINCIKELGDETKGLALYLGMERKFISIFVNKKETLLKKCRHMGHIADFCKRHLMIVMQTKGQTVMKNGVAHQTRRTLFSLVHKLMLLMRLQSVTTPDREFAALETGSNDCELEFSGAGGADEMQKWIRDITLSSFLKHAEGRFLLKTLAQRGLVLPSKLGKKHEYDVQGNFEGEDCDQAEYGTLEEMVRER